MDKSKKEPSSQFNDYLSHDYGVNHTYNNILEWNRNLFNSNNSVKYDCNTDLEFKNKILRTYPNNEGDGNYGIEKKDLYSITNKY